MTSESPAFTQTQLDKGVKFLENHNFYEMFNEFKIPEEWHEKREVGCGDLFNMRIEQKFVLEYDGTVDECDGQDYIDMKFPLIDEVFGKNNSTCATVAKYLYELLLYNKKLEKQLVEKREFEVNFFAEKNKEFLIYLEEKEKLLEN
jgi:hypothetical protein